MAYSIGHELIFTPPNGKKEKVTILKRAVDYKNRVINEPNYKGNFDYLFLLKEMVKLKTFFVNTANYLKT